MNNTIKAEQNEDKMTCFCVSFTSLSFLSVSTLLHFISLTEISVII